MSTNSEIPDQLWSCINHILGSRADPPAKHNWQNSLCGVSSGYFKDNIALVQSSFSLHMLK